MADGTSSARVSPAPFPVTHLDRSLLVLVAHEAQHDGHVVFFPHNHLALGAGPALVRFDLRHRETPPPRCAFAGFAARYRAGRSGTASVCVSPIDPNAPREVMRLTRSARRVGSREGSENSPRYNRPDFDQFVSRRIPLFREPPHFNTQDTTAKAVTQNAESRKGEL